MAARMCVKSNINPIFWLLKNISPELPFAIIFVFCVVTGIEPYLPDASANE